MARIPIGKLPVADPPFTATRVENGSPTPIASYPIRPGFYDILLCHMFILREMNPIKKTA